MSRFSHLFRGYEYRFGRYEIRVQEDSGKMTGSARTIDASISEDDYEAHLKGECGIGVIPLTEDNLVHFAAVDVDKYGMPDNWHFTVAKKVRNLPLVVTRSKSNGLHMWLFSEEGVEASLAVEFLKNVCSQLGYSGSEIFPKQVQRASKEDTGNWINLPYFGGSRTVVSVVEKKGSLHTGPEDIDTFLLLAEEVARQVTGPWLKSFNSQLKSERAGADETEDWYDGPPCLQRLFVGDKVTLKKLEQKYAKGELTQDQYEAAKLDCSPQLGEGGRNIAFFNAAQYLFRKYGEGSDDKVKEVLNEVNIKSNLGLSLNEIVMTLKQGKKEYNYQCNKDPMQCHCNRALCRRRTYGIGSRSTDVGVEVSGFTKILMDPPLYAFNVDGSRVRMTSEELLNQRRFASVVLDACSKIWPTLQEHKFKDLLSAWMTNMTEVEGPPDSDRRSMIKRALQTFIAEKTNTSDSDEPYHSGRVLLRNGGEEAWFDMRFFDRFLKREGFTYDRRTLSTVLQDIGCTYKSQTTTIAGKSCRPWIAFPKVLEESNE